MNKSQSTLEATEPGGESLTTSFWPKSGHLDQMFRSHQLTHILASFVPGKSLRLYKSLLHDLILALNSKVQDQPSDLKQQGGGTRWSPIGYASATRNKST